MTPPSLPPHDIDVLRRLAERKAAAAASAVNRERREAWYRHNALEKTRPLILAEIQGVMDETVPDRSLTCTDEWARALERTLRSELYEHEVLQDDHVLEPWIDVRWHVQTTPYVDES
jgi:hypothetical protein